MNFKKLIQTLDTLPPDFKLVPINGDKKPLGYEWQHRPFNIAQMREGLILGGLRVKNKKRRWITVWLPGDDHPNDREIGGFGVLLGQPTEQDGQTFYLMALDRDGKSATALIKKLSEGKPLPKTVAFSSGRPWRCQYLFLIPEKRAETVRARIIQTAKAKDEHLEFRWKGMISVVPPSVHPITGEYRWRRSFKSTQIAIAPEWIVQMMERCHPVADEKPTKISRGSASNSRDKNREIQTAIELLDRIPPECADDYWAWIKIGTALKTISEDLLPLWERWSQQSSKYKPGECQYKWRNFQPGKVTMGTLYYYASNKITR